MGCVIQIFDEIETLSPHNESNALLYISSLHPYGFWINEFEVPSITVDYYKMEKEPYGTNIPDNTVVFDNTMDIQIYVDKNYQVFSKLYKQITSYSSMNYDENYTNFDKYAILYILSTDRQNVITYFVFENVNISNISGLRYKKSSNEEVIANLQYKYDYFYPKDLKFEGVHQ